MADVKKTEKKEKLNKKASKASLPSKKATVKPVKKVLVNKTDNKLRSTSNLSKPKKQQKFYDQLKLSESYVSLVLGAIVVLGISVLFLFFLKESRNSTVSKPEVLNSKVKPVLTKKPDRTYTMGENETLWDVAVKFYGDGFAYPRIIEANKDKIENADFVPPGTVIIIPQTK